LRFAFTLDASLIPTGETQDTIQVFRDGAQVQNCTEPSGGTAPPDPCVSSREPLASGDVRLTVLASASGTWTKTTSAVPNGRHTYKARATDAANNTSSFSNIRTVTVDTNRPTGMVTINSGDASTKSRTVTLTLKTTDPSPASGVSLMRFRNENTSTWSSWQTYNTSKSWTLSGGDEDGVRSVSGSGGNVSTQAGDTIKYAP
jgi:hypothetical protein